MDYSIDSIYKQYIKPLSYKEQILIVQKIMHDFLNEQKHEFTNQLDRLKSVQKFKGIAKSNFNPSEEDWYKQ